MEQKQSVASLCTQDGAVRFELGLEPCVFLIDITDQGLPDLPDSSSKSDHSHKAKQGARAGRKVSRDKLDIDWSTI